MHTKEHTPELRRAAVKAVWLMAFVHRATEEIATSSARLLGLSGTAELEELLGDLADTAWTGRPADWTPLTELMDTPPPAQNYVKLPVTEPVDGWCVFLDTFLGVRTPIVTDGEGMVVLFADERSAQLEIADDLQTRLWRFQSGERIFEDAIHVEEYVLPVTIHPDGTFVDVDDQEYKVDQRDA